MKIIDKILTEWAYRVHDGMPDPTNPLHLINLDEALSELKIPRKAVEYIKEKVRKYVDNPQNQKLNRVGEPWGSTGDDKKKIDKSKKVDMSSDHAQVEQSLNMTKAQAKENAKKKGKKDVGLGTDESRAGEAMVHKGLQMLQNGTSWEEVDKYFKSIVNGKGHVLNSKEGKKWAGAALASLRKLDSYLPGGIKDVVNISWDTDDGRTAIGVDPKLSTSSDMFVTTKNGMTLGISLKKSGAVFLASKGWPKETKRLLAELAKDLSPEELKELEESMHIEHFAKDRAQRYADMANGKPDGKPFDINKIIEFIKKEPKTEEEMAIMKTMNLGNPIKPEYQKWLDNPEGLMELARSGELGLVFENKSGDFRTKVGHGNAMKVLAKLAVGMDREKYEHIRKSDHNLTIRMFEAMKNNPNVEIAMKKFILNSMHIPETLGLNEKTKEGGVDAFFTLYGIEPDGSVMDEQTLTDLFGSQFAQILQEIREKPPTKTFEDLENLIMDNIEIDYQSGNIMFLHETNKKFPLFNLKGRSRQMGSSPTMEMVQTNVMAYALKYGTFDYTQWPPEVQSRMVDKFQDVPEEKG